MIYTYTYEQFAKRNPIQPKYQFKYNEREVSLDIPSYFYTRIDAENIYGATLQVNPKEIKYRIVGSGDRYVLTNICRAKEYEFLKPVTDSYHEKLQEILGPDYWALNEDFCIKLLSECFFENGVSVYWVFEDSMDFSKAKVTVESAESKNQNKLMELIIF